MRDFLAFSLARLGLYVQVARDGQEAVEWVAGTNFDAVILDSVMPRLNGMEALKQIKMLRPRLPIIFLSGVLPNADPAMPGIQIIPHGVAAYLQKPVELNTLIETLSGVLGVNLPADARG